MLDKQEPLRLVLLLILITSIGFTGSASAASTPKDGQVVALDRTRPAKLPHLKFPPGHSKLLWVGAHPDDEVLAAPLLAWLCAESGWSCTLLIATRGERGHCLLPSGCQPTLADVRSYEAGEVSRLLGAKLILWDLADGPASSPELVRSHWESEDEGLTARLVTLIEDEQPDVILTFDPRHGSTCHPDHRAIGSIVIDAAASVMRSVLLLENRFHVLDDSVTVTPANVDASRLVYFSASRETSSAGVTYWSHASMFATIYGSQFSPELVKSLADTPPARQFLFFARNSGSSSFSGQGMCEEE